MPLRALLADDHELVRSGLKALLEDDGLTVVAEASNGREAVALAQQHQPDIAVLDLSMPVLNGLDAARQMLRDSTRIRIILLTAHTEPRYVLESMQAGIHGYVLKTQAGADLKSAIAEVSGGSIYLSPRISRAVVDAYKARAATLADPLTLREREVLQLVAEGRTTKEVATVLGISAKTAESHRNHIMKKLDIHETANLARYAIRHGIIEA